MVNVVVMEEELIVNLSLDTNMMFNSMPINDPLCILGANPSQGDLWLVFPHGDLSLGIMGTDLVMGDGKFPIPKKIVHLSVKLQGERDWDSFSFSVNNAYTPFPDLDEFNFFL
jgi:hypothetical protein